MSKTVMIVIAAACALQAEYYGLYQIAEVPVTPRVSAMGGAGTALCGGGFGMYNPASPAFAVAPFLSFEFGQEPGDLSKAGIETSWMFPKWFAGASLRVRSADFFVTDERTDETTMHIARSSNQATQAAVTGGYVAGRLAAGSAVCYLHERVGDRSWHAFTFTPGVIFELVPGAVTLGASLSHYLRVDTTENPWYRTPVSWYRAARGFPRYARAGVAWRDTVVRWALPFTAVCDFVYSDVYERFMVPLGAEVMVLPTLAARAGVCVNHPADLAHFGVGLQVQNVRFDFDYGVYRAVSDVEVKWMFGLTYLLKKNKAAVPAPIKKTRETAPAAPAESPAPVNTVPVPEDAEDSAEVPLIEGDTGNAAPEVQPDSTRALDSLPLPESGSDATDEER